MYVYVYIYVCVCMYIYICKKYTYGYIYIYIIYIYLCMLCGSIFSGAGPQPPLPRHGLRLLAPARGRRCAGHAAGAPGGQGASRFLAAAYVPGLSMGSWESG